MVQQQNGVSLIELLTIIAITAVLVVVAVPSFVSYVQLNRIKVLSQNLYYNLQYARSEAIKRNASIYVTFTTGTSWCYGINVGSACTCSTPSTCTLGATTSNNTQATLSLTGSSSSSLIFEPNHGGANSTPTLTYAVTGGTSAINVMVGLTGNMQTCSANVSGYSACP